MKYPVGPQTIKKAAQTEPGKLAALLNRVLYSADYMDIQPEGFNTKIKKWVAYHEVFKGDDLMPEGIPTCGETKKYFETEALMRAIRDYLEFRSFEEVIP